MIFLNLKYILRYRKIIFYSVLFFFSVHFVFGQSIASTRKAITAEFSFDNVEFRDLAFITNVLKVRNNNGKTYTFSINLNIPMGWKSLVDENKEYTLKPNDSVFVPVRFVTNSKKVKGGTKYSIAAYVNTNEGKQMAYARFITGRPKISNWNMHILPQPRIYFLNGENNSAFQVNVANEGDESQDIILSTQKTSTNLILADSNNMSLKKNFTEIKLNPYSDTTIKYNVSIQTDLRNLRRVDVWNYHPILQQKERRYSLFLRASEVRIDKNSNLEVKSKKVDFIKLANNIDFVKLFNSTQVGNGSNTIPLTIFMNVSNLLGQMPVALVNIQGNSQIGKKSSISYLFQTSWLYYKYSNDFFTNRLNGNIIYTRGKGFIGLSTGFNVKGLNAGYQINKNHYVNGFIFRQHFFGASTYNNFGLNYYARFGKINMTSTANFSIQSGLLRRYSFQTNLNIPVSSSLRLFLTAGQFLIRFTNIFSLRSDNLGAGVSFIRNRFSSNVLAQFSLVHNYQVNQVINSRLLYNFSLVNTFKLRNKGAFNTSSFYQTYFNNFNFGLPNDFVNFSNVFSYVLPERKRIFTYSPSIYFNYFRLPLDSILADSLIMGGFQLNYSKNSNEKQFFYGGMTRLGYSQLLNFKEKGTFFQMSSNVFARYRVYNFMLMYNYGGLGNFNMANVIKYDDGVYPQILRINFGHQFQFINKHFILENNPTFTYLNKIKRKSFGLFSQLYYYSDNNWRFSLNATLNFTKGLSIRYLFNTNSSVILPTIDNENVSTTKNLMIGFTVKKDFSIPIPKRFRNGKVCDAKLQVFLDINGNHRKDEGEVPVENVILRLNEFEVITDENGMGNFINTEFAKYHLQVLPLTDIGSWFPNVLDSVDVCGPDIMFIPFSKGVQVYGTVDLDRESYSGELFDKLDVSRFKIYLIDSTGRTFSSITDNRGNFNFYVPYQKYTLKFDEKALGSSFYLPENDIPLDLRNGIESYYHHFLIIERKRRVKKKVFGPDGKVTIVEETAAAQNTGNGNNGNGKPGTGNNGNGKPGTGNNGNGKPGTGNNGNGNTGNNNNNPTSVAMKEHQMDSLIDVINKLISKMATKADVRLIVEQELQQLMDELNATFTIKIDELPKGKAPSGLLLQLVRLKKVEELKTASGSTIYYSGDYTNVNEAERFCRDYQTSGFRNAKVVKRKNLSNGNR